ncbi:glucose-6-phosphate isomerase [Neptuniibacter sp. CAU 1671]|uniref:glucose-6-phosphate isomerase n=1 Tax=Neptuniibacter sp. CAU 1671 TaxID=3032593 RepID=UPI0023DC4498|nr:glucose-6-phosphate isomerase [Neptuniibacter sp. CAU 1671]MDF2181514.1 glucose-6-phosphate isomerase [Neptuniibacter sp. CAU 1671]
MPLRSTTAAWKNLREHADQLSSNHISDLFSDDPTRFNGLTFRTGQLLLDLSKQRLNQTTLHNLSALAEEADLHDWIEALFTGQKVNCSENRAALHTALRSPKASSLTVNGQDIIAAVHNNLDHMRRIVDRIHQGQWRGFTGHSINTIVNIGVGGSDLGPLMTCRALAEHQSGAANPVQVHFVSSMDGSQLSELLSQLNPARTLFVLASKSFTTIDTLANAATAREWLRRSGHTTTDDMLTARHFIAVTANTAKASEWGIPPSNQLEFWDWTGGRYSMWSAIGLPIALKLGMDGFLSLLEGAHAMDEHFRHTPFLSNLPVLMALVDVWNINFLNIHAHAILPYDGRLGSLPAYLEQLEMESNGKSVTRGGETVDFHTCPILWGEVGTNAQHAFYQLLHQGTESVMCDFIVAARRYQTSGSEELQHQHRLNLANCFAQSRLLALGDSILDNADTQPAHKRYRGNQPCSTLILDELCPFSLGQLIALYEHKVFVQAVIWGINPFDQWGVELGKQVATSLLGALENPESTPGFDQSTNGLLAAVHAKQKGEA